MVRLLSIGIGAVATIIAMLPVMVIARYTIFKSYGKKKLMLVFLYALYLAAVFTVVGIPSINGLTLEAGFNFIPLINSINITTVLNIFLFIPLGFLLPAIWNEYCSLKKTLFTGFGLSLIIETMQIFTFRLTDVDDLITNTLGTILGYYLSMKFSEPLRLKLSSSAVKCEPILICLIVFLVMFTVQPLISDVAWNYILSSPLWEAIR